MQISDTEVRKVLETSSIKEEIADIFTARRRSEDVDIVATVAKRLMDMKERQDRIAELRSRIKE